VWRFPKLGSCHQEVLGRTIRSTGFVTTLLLMTAIGQTQTLTSAQARAHDGETATVCGIIATEHVAARSRGKPTFIDLDAPFPNQEFTILVWEEDRQNTGALPRSGHLCATGLMNYYQGVPEIVVRSSKQLSR
jgi:hypothetical protein